jgi:hypothetical protein
VQYGHNIVVEAGETAGDVVCLGCSILVRGTSSDTVAIGGSITVEGSVQGDAVAIAGAMRLGPNASVKGDVVAVGGALDRDTGATVGGEVVSKPSIRLGNFAVAGIFGLVALMVIPTLVLGFLLALLVYAIAGEHRMRNMAQAIHRQSGMSLLAGLVTLAAFVMLAIAFAHASVLTAMLEMLNSVAFAVLLVVGYTGLSYTIGARVSPDSGPMGQVMLGALLIIVLQLIPVINVVMVLFVLLALGSAVLTGLGSAPDWFDRHAAAPLSRA